MKNCTIERVSVRQIKNLGNYESITLELEAVVTGEPDTAIDELAEVVIYKLNQGDRTAKFEEYTEKLKDKDITEAKRKDMENYIEKYNALEKRMVEIEFK